jgi:hypothetical protein
MWKALLNGLVIGLLIVCALLFWMMNTKFS